MLKFRSRPLFQGVLLLFVINITLSWAGGWRTSRRGHILLGNVHGRKSFQTIPKSRNQLNCPPQGCKGNLTDFDKLRLKRIQRTAVQDYGAHFSVENYMPPQLLELAKMAQQRNQQMKIENQGNFNQSQIILNSNVISNANNNIAPNHNQVFQHAIQQHQQDAKISENLLAQASFSQKSGGGHHDHEEQQLDEAIATAAAKLQQAYADQLAQSSQIMDQLAQSSQIMDQLAQSSQIMDQLAQSSQISDQQDLEMQPHHQQQYIPRHDIPQHQPNYDHRSNEHFQQEVSPIVPTPIPDWPPPLQPQIQQRSGEIRQNHDQYFQSQPHPHPVYHPEPPPPPQTQNHNQLQHRQEQPHPPVQVQNFEFTLDPDGSVNLGQSKERNNFASESQPHPQSHQNYDEHTNEQQGDGYEYQNQHHPQSQPSAEQYPRNHEQEVYEHHEHHYSQSVNPDPPRQPPHPRPLPPPHQDLRARDPYPGPRQEHPLPSNRLPLPSPSSQMLPGSKIIAAVPNPKYDSHPQMTPIHPHQGHPEGPREGQSYPNVPSVFSSGPPPTPTTGVIPIPSTSQPQSRADYYDPDDHDHGWGWDSVPYGLDHDHHFDLDTYHPHHFHLKKKEELLVSLAAEVAWKVITSYIFVFVANAVIGLIGKYLGLSDSYLETKITLGKDGRHPFEHYGSGGGGGGKGHGKGHNHSPPPKGWGGGGKDVYYPGNPLYHPSSALYHQPTYQYYPKGKEHTLLGYDQHHALKYAKKYSKKYSKKAGKYGLKPKPILPYIPAFNYGHQSIPAWGRDDQNNDHSKGEKADPGVKADKLGKAKSSEEKSKEQEEGNKSKGESDESGGSASGDVDQEDETKTVEQSVEQEIGESKVGGGNDIVEEVEVELVDPKGVVEEEEDEEGEEEGQTTLAPEVTPESLVSSIISSIGSSSSSDPTTTFSTPVNVTKEGANQPVSVSSFFEVIPRTKVDEESTVMTLSTNLTTPGSDSTSTPPTMSSTLVSWNPGLRRRNLIYRKGRPL